MKLEELKKQMSDIFGDKYIDGTKVNNYEKRKLNSKNPKYMDKSLVTEVKTEKKLIREVKGCKIYAVKYL